MEEEIIHPEPTVGIHLSASGQVQITFVGAICAMDDVAGEAVLTIHATQLEELRDAILDFLPN
ncbi:hypothetical protein [Agrobacterium arsenijevicii]|uniref:Uncharacterized protein n=1 Tax=Agrobacterium arsenijevicii TaxID=1585697 RepID=A0ABR5D818_9HYPH|nr:hypothetical protein RP75_13230 [Agrobacterium arsenijevicii]